MKIQEWIDEKMTMVDVEKKDEHNNVVKSREIFLMKETTPVKKIVVRKRNEVDLEGNPIITGEEETILTETHTWTIDTELFKKCFGNIIESMFGNKYDKMLAESEKKNYKFKPVLDKWKEAGII